MIFIRANGLIAWVAILIAVEVAQVFELLLRVRGRGFRAVPAMAHPPAFSGYSRDDLGPKIDKIA